MRKPAFFAVIVGALAAALAMPARAQSTYQPKFKGDPARSDSEAAALGYMRTVVTAQREYKKKHAAYATSLVSLVHSGSFTRRMVSTDRGDYKASFRGDGKGYSLGMTPNQFAPDHRAFYANETGIIRGDEQQPANAQSPPVK
jgi:hypothetical protein